MTKTEIESYVVAYANKAHYNSDKATDEVKDRIHTAMKAIIAISYAMQVKGVDFKFGSNTAVIKILAEMRNDISAIIRKRTDVSKDISKRLNKNFKIPATDWDSNDWIDSIRFDKSYSQRLGIYVSRLKFELEAFVAVGLDKGNTQLETSDWFMSKIESPHTDLAIIAAIGFASVRTSEILKVGMGGITSAYKSILRLNDDILMSGYHISNRNTWNGMIKGKYVQTMNDSLVCSTCQGNVGFTFKPEEYVVPVHNRCRCYEVPILI